MNTRRCSWALAVLVMTGHAQASQLLPDGWFARYLSEHNAPGVLSGPVEEKWRAEGHELVVVGDRVFLTTKTSETRPATLPGSEAELRALVAAMDASATYGLECRNLQDGHVLWRVEGDKQATERLGSPLCFEGYVLVTVLSGKLQPPGSPPMPVTGPAERPTSRPTATRPAFRSQLRESFWLLDAKTGQILYRFGPDEPENARDLMAHAKLYHSLRSGGDAAWVLATVDKELWAKTILNPGGVTVPVSADPAQWSLEDVRTLTKTLKIVPEHGLGKVAPSGEMFYFDAQRNRLINRELSSGRIRWEIPFLFAATTALYCPPVLVTYSSPSAVTAYDLSAGRPVWTCDWEAAEETYTTGIAALQDGFLLLTNPQIRRPTAHRRSGPGVSTESTTRPCLLKLDRSGKVVFRQELPIRLSYGRMVLAENAVLVGSEHSNMWSCFAASKSASPRKQSPADERKIQQLVTEYDHADAMSRTGICAELASLGDRRLVDRVIADLGAAVRDKGLYAQCLGLLGDAQTIPKLLPLLEDPDWQVQQQARIAIEALTDGKPLESEVYRQWRDRRIPALRAEYDRAKYPSEQVKFAAQLRELQDPDLLDRLFHSLDNAPPNARDFYIREIGALKDKRAILKLIGLFKQRDVSMHHNVDEALRSTIGVSFVKPEAWEEWWAAHRHLYEAATSGPAGR